MKTFDRYVDAKYCMNSYELAIYPLRCAPKSMHHQLQQMTLRNSSIQIAANVKFLIVCPSTCPIQPSPTPLSGLLLVWTPPHAHYKIQ